MPTKSEHDLLRPIDIAREYRIGRDQIRRMCHDGTLPHLMNGRRMLIPRWVFTRWVEQQVTVHPVTR